MSDIDKNPTYIREIELRYKEHQINEGSPVNEPLTDSRKVFELFSDMQNEAKEKLMESKGQTP